MYDLIFQELQRLPGVVPRSAFGHKGFAVGSSLFAFIDDEHLAVKTLGFTEDSAKVPKGLDFFMPGDSMSRTWIRLPVTDDLRHIQKHWDMIAESYKLALERDIEKQRKTKRGK